MACCCRPCQSTSHPGGTGCRSATFLPQVWDDLPDPEQFLAQLCRKMGCSSSHWKYNLMQVQTYRVEEFSE